MALVSPKQPCPICGQPLGDAEILGFAYYGVCHQEYEAFDDSAAHQECLRNWEMRDDFVKFWNHQIRISHGVLAARDYEVLVVKADGRVWYEKPKKEPAKKAGPLRRLFGKVKREGT